MARLRSRASLLRSAVLGSTVLRSTVLCSTASGLPMNSSKLFAGSTGATAAGALAAAGCLGGGGDNLFLAALSRRFRSGNRRWPLPLILCATQAKLHHGFA